MRICAFVKFHFLLASDSACDTFFMLNCEGLELWFHSFNNTDTVAVGAMAAPLCYRHCSQSRWYCATLNLKMWFPVWSIKNVASCQCHAPIACTKVTSPVGMPFVFLIWNLVTLELGYSVRLRNEGSRHDTTWMYFVRSENDFIDKKYTEKLST